MTQCNRTGCTNKTSTPKGKYCSLSCAATENNRKHKKRQKRNPGVYNCLYCNKTHENRSNTMNKYCDNVCQQKHRKQIRDRRVVDDELMGASVGHKRQIINYLKDNNKWLCHQCGVTEDVAPMEFHHIDGNRYNNRLSNSMVLCRNCHGRTINFKSRNKGYYRYKDIISS